METLEWYVIEYSLTGANDWYESHHSADTLASAREELARVKSDAVRARKQYGELETYDYRIGKRTLLSEVVE